MEFILENRFNDTRKGVIRRRDLLRIIGIAGIAGFTTPVFAKPDFAASFPQSLPEGPAVFPITTVNHLSLNGVADYAKSRDWYVNVFGMRIAWDNGKSCALEMGPLPSPNGIYLVQGKPGDKATVGHIGFGIPDWWSKKAAMKAEMDRSGIKGVRPDGESGWTCNTPSGYVIQLVPEKDESMYPGAARPCENAQSQACKAGWQEGLKNLADLPKPSGTGFQCIAFNRVILRTPEIAKDRNFFKGIWGMRVILDGEEGENAECLLKFGQNTLCLRGTHPPATKPSCNEYSFLAENYEPSAAREDLKRRGLNPEMDPEMGWVVSDPDGLRIGVRGA